MAHIIVCGLGQVGFRVSILLRQLGEDVTVVTSSVREPFNEDALDAGVKIIMGDARRGNLLIEAGLETADAIIPATDDDLVNIEIALDARKINPNIRIVARLFDQTLARRLEETLGIQRALAMSQLSAPAFASAAFGEQVRGSFLVDQEMFVVGQVPISSLRGERVDGLVGVLRTDAEGRVSLALPDEGSFADREQLDVVAERHAFSLLTRAGMERAQRRVREGIRKWLESMNPLYAGRIFLMIWRNTPSYLRSVVWTIFVLFILSVVVFRYSMNPPLTMIDALYYVTTTLTTTGYGDITPRGQSPWLIVYACVLMVLGSASVATLYSVMTDFIVTQRFAEMLGRSRIPEDDHVIVVGLGTVGFRTVAELERMGERVVVIDIDGETRYRNLLPKTIPFVVGDARDQDTLDRAGIQSATSIISATGNDAVNLSIVLAAKASNPRIRTVARLFDGNFASKVQHALNVDAAISASRVAAPTFVGAALYPDALLCYIEGATFYVLLRRDDPKSPLEIITRPLAPVRSSI